jgi:hypothetical protein
MGAMSNYDILKNLANQGVKQRKSHTDKEHQLQVECVKWFRLQYPHLAHALFAVPNGGRRDATTGAKLKAEGALAGVSDIILLYMSGNYGALLIEMKTKKGAQSDKQKEWQAKITSRGEYKYVICRSFDDFKREIETYIPR